MKQYPIEEKESPCPVLQAKMDRLEWMRDALKKLPNLPSGNFRKALEDDIHSELNSQNGVTVDVIKRLNEHVRAIQEITSLVNSCESNRASTIKEIVQPALSRLASLIQADICRLSSLNRC